MSKKFVAVLMANIFVLGGFSLNGIYADEYEDCEACSHCGARKISKKCSTKPGRLWLRKSGAKKCNVSTRPYADASQQQCDMNGRRSVVAGQSVQSDKDGYQDGQLRPEPNGDNRGSPRSEYQGQQNIQGDMYSDAGNAGYADEQRDGRETHVTSDAQSGDVRFNSHNNAENAQRRDCNCNTGFCSGNMNTGNVNADDRSQGYDHDAAKQNRPQYEDRYANPNTSSNNEACYEEDSGNVEQNNDVTQDVAQNNNLVENTRDVAPANDCNNNINAENGVGADVSRDNYDVRYDNNMQQQVQQSYQENRHQQDQQPYQDVQPQEVQHAYQDGGQQQVQQSYQVQDDQSQQRQDVAYANSDAQYNDGQQPIRQDLEDNGNVAASSNASNDEYDNGYRA